MASDTDIHIGTAGWSYPEGHGTWNGVFYPARGAGRGRIDELQYYAERFNTVEVNSTFYRPPQPGVTRRWVERTPHNFEFSLKLYQKFTHPEMYRKATGREDVHVGQGDVDEFRRGLEPIAEAGKLGVLLAQFPPSFKDSEESRAFLNQLLRAFHDYPTAVELRHRSWSDHVGATLDLLNASGAALVQIDEPKFSFSIRQDFLPNVATFYYMRLHGRNAEKWWSHTNAEQRYDYLYSNEELRPFAEAAETARRSVKKLYLYMNNHFAAKAVANAVMLKHLLGLPATGQYPPEFITRYPALEGIVSSTPPAVSRSFF